MKKNEIIFWAVLISISIVFASVVIFYKPISAPSRYDTLYLRAATKTVEINCGEPDYESAKKAINQAINSSRYSLLNPSSTDKITCDDDTVWSYKYSKKYWVECHPAKGKYKKLFFIDEDAEGRQIVVLFTANNKDSYNDGKLLLLYDVNTPRLLDFLKSV